MCETIRKELMKVKRIDFNSGTSGIYLMVAMLLMLCTGLQAKNLGEFDLVAGRSIRSNTGSGARYAHDKDLGTRYESENWHQWPQWLVCDFDSAYQVHKVCILLPPGDKSLPTSITYDMAIQGSLDNVTWFDLLPNSSYTWDTANNMTQSIIFPARKTKHVRLYVTGSSNRSFMVAEWNAYTRDVVAPYPGTPETRRQWLVDQMSKRETMIENRDGYWAARLVNHVDVEWAIAKLQRDVDDYHQYCDVFTAWLFAGDQFPPDLVSKMKNLLSGLDYDSPPWCSSNFRFRWIALGYLVGEYLPDVPDSKGRKGQALCEHTKHGLNYSMYQEFDRVVTRGHTEWGSTQYTYFSYYSTNLIAEFAKDPEVKRRAQMVREWFWTNWALDWNDGYLVNTITRSKIDGNISHNPTLLQGHAVLAWMFWGAHRGLNDFGTDSHREIHHYGEESYLFPAVGKPFEIPDIINRIARKTNYVYKKRIKFEDTCNGKEGDSYLYGYIKPHFGLCSQTETGAFDHHSSTRAILRWHTPEPDGTFYVSICDPGGTGNNLSPLTGDKSFHKMMQHEYTLIGTVNKDRSSDNNSLSAVFPADGAVLKRIEASGWVFAHGGSTLFAYRCAKPYYWEKFRNDIKYSGATLAYNHDVVRSDADKNGYIVETAEVESYAGGGLDAELNRFKEAVLSQSKVDFSHVDDPNPRVVYKSIHGYTLDLTYPMDAKLNENAVDYNRYRLLDSPYVVQDFNNKTLVLKEGGENRIYDFENWKVTVTHDPK